MDSAPPTRATPTPAPTPAPTPTPKVPQRELPQRELPQRPAMWVALAFGVGVALHALLPANAGILTSAAMALALMAAAWMRFRKAAATLLLGAMVLLGAARTQMAVSYEGPQSVVPLVGDEAVLVRAALCITDLPQWHRNGRQVSTSTRCRIIALHADGRTVAADSAALLRVEGERPDLRPGTELEAVGWLARIHGPDNPGEYNWQEHFARQGMQLRISIPEAGTIRITKAGEEGWYWKAREKVRAALAAGFAAGQETDLALVRALLFGDNDEHLQQVWTDFRASGTAHHLSISGLHLAVVASMILVIARLLALRPRWVLVVVPSIALLYGSLTNLSPPVIRSLLLCVAISVAFLARRNVDPIQALAVSVLAMLIYNPLDLYNAGFQLSFGAVAGLMLFARPVGTWLVNLEHEHQRMARRIRPPRGWGKWWHGLWHNLKLAVATGLVAYAISMPLIAWHFRQTNPWAIPGSILLAPLVAVTLGLGLLKVVVTMLYAPLGVLLAPLVSDCGWLMRQCVALLAGLPGAQLNLLSLPAWLIVVYVILLTLPLLVNWRWAPVAPFGAISAMMLLPLWLPLWPGRPRDVQITFLSVGNGSCAAIRHTDGSATLVDCGALQRPDLYASTIAPALRELGISRVSTIIITHGDHDHVSALEELTASEHPQVYRGLLRDAAIPDGLHWTVLGPAFPFSLTSNDASGVLRLDACNRRILFTGDIEQVGMQNLLRQGEEIACDVLVAPHHGAYQANTSAFLLATHPSLIISSSSAQLRRTQQRFQAAASGYNHLRTGISGAITITIRPDGAMKVEQFHGRTTNPNQ